jgi:hypothetical protein
MSTAADPLPHAEPNISDILARAWKLFTDKPAEHIITGLLVSVLGAMTLGILFGPLLVAYIRMIDRQRQGETININEVFSGFDAFVPSFLVTLVIGICAFFGMLMLVLPGILVLLIWSFALWYVALRGESTVGALSASWSLCKAHVGPVLVVFLTFMVLNAAGSAVLFGALFTFPFALIVHTIAFRDLVG